jgi:hypothetical protein
VGLGGEELGHWQTHMVLTTPVMIFVVSLGYLKTDTLRARLHIFVSKPKWGSAAMFSRAIELSKITSTGVQYEQPQSAAFALRHWVWIGFNPTEI